MPWHDDEAPWTSRDRLFLIGFAVWFVGGAVLAWLLARHLAGT